MTDDSLPEADRLGDAPHPRTTRDLFGQDAAQAAFVSSQAGGRAHHAVMLQGPKGIGKATLAWRLARHLLTQAPAEAGLFGEPEPPTSLNVPEDHPIQARIAALSEPRLFLLRREWDLDKKRFKAAIGIDDVRRMKGFFGLSAPDGGARVVIIDAADEMTTPAANAVLKMLEEPPANATLILVVHQPARILPTIRSRCQVLKMRPLAPEDLVSALEATGTVLPEHPETLAALAQGSVGRALSLLEGGGLARYSEILGLFKNLPGLDRPKAIAMAETAGARGAEDHRAMTTDLFATLLARLARYGAGISDGPEAAAGEFETFARLAPDLYAAQKWAAFAEEAGKDLERGFAVNLDAPALFLDMIFKAQQVAEDLSRR
ncbi:MAG: DNA polymerase III subunit delta' [Pseudomonadota bacterium]